MTKPTITKWAIRIPFWVTVVLIILKLFHVILWNWYLVCCPMLGGIGLLVLLIILIKLFYA